MLELKTENDNKIVFYHLFYDNKVDVKKISKSYISNDSYNYFKVRCTPATRRISYIPHCSEHIPQPKYNFLGSR